jgi:hypothetical protein
VIGFRHNDDISIFIKNAAMITITSPQSGSAMNPNLIITLNNPHDPQGWHDGSRAGFSTDRRRAKPFPTRREARMALEDLWRRFPRQTIEVRPCSRSPLRLGWFAAGLLMASLTAGCSHAPISASDCGRHFVGGSGLLGLVASAGAFDRDPGPDCQPQGYAVTSSSGYIPPNETWMPPDPALPLPGSRLLVPGGGGTLMELGGGSQQLMVPAGGGTFLELP